MLEEIDWNLVMFFRILLTSCFIGKPKQDQAYFVLHLLTFCFFTNKIKLNSTSADVLVLFFTHVVNCTIRES